MFIFLFLDKPQYLGADLEEVGATGEVADIDLCALSGGDKLSGGSVDAQCGIVGNTLYAENLVRRIGIDDDHVGLHAVRGGGDDRTTLLEGDFDDVVERLVA